MVPPQYAKEFNLLQDKGKPARIKLGGAGANALIAYRTVLAELNILDFKLTGVAVFFAATISR